MAWIVAFIRTARTFLFTPCYLGFGCCFLGHEVGINWDKGAKISSLKGSMDRPIFLTSEEPVSSPEDIQ